MAVTKLIKKGIKKVVKKVHSEKNPRKKASTYLSGKGKSTKTKTKLDKAIEFAKKTGFLGKHVEPRLKQIISKNKLVDILNDPAERKKITAAVAKRVTQKKAPTKKTKAKPTREEIKKANQLIARHKGKPMSDTFERTVFDKKIVKKAQENIARIAKKRGITQREFRINNLKNPSVRLVYNNNPSMARQDGGNKLWNKLADTVEYSEFY